ncbi:amidohydrolase family protein [Amycolatopsis pithecellobii]|uniref:Amidohydrolase family protein n=1 Tax=Amycolatopsis pithecellobii TaxID=664692 RepID=A0A6N7Z6M0_9PSEU|nr:amidohydrolase family protein [Amycolatopsis pithecellobii]MTD57589.1 amidohydrolase family protein [Amycolatopsis pithecellobii]
MTERAPVTPLVLANCSVIDVENGDVLSGAEIHVEDGRITAVGRAPGGRDRNARVVDLGGGWVTPGLWDCHAHLGLLIPDPTNYGFFETQARRSIRAGQNAIDALRVGITTVRVTGEAEYIDLAWRDAFATGQFTGPRIFGAGHLMRCTGGHLNRGPKQYQYVRDAIEIDGTTEAMKQTRQQITMGVDLIKIVVTGGMQAGEGVGDLQLTKEEVAAICTIAHGRGRQVTAHAGGGQATRDALDAGIDAIEHGYDLDEQTIDMMAERGTFLVPTIGVTHDDEFACEHMWPDATRAKASRLAPAHRETVLRAKESGITICSGGDKYPIAESGLREIQRLVDVGLTAAEALRAATINGARLMRADDWIGTIEPGKVADFAVWARNPLDDIGALDELRRVYLGGRLVTDAGSDGALNPADRARGVSRIGIPDDVAVVRPTYEESSK